MNAEQKSPEEIREEIEGTRKELGDTVEALAGKADVKGQAKAKVDSAKQRADQLAARAKNAAPDSFGAGVQQVAESTQRNPVPMALAAAFGAGVAVGWILGR
jgi:hypothetical protein